MDIGSVIWIFRDCGCSIIWILWILATVNKAKFWLKKHYNLNPDLALGECGIWLLVWFEFTLWKTLIAFTSSLLTFICPFTSATIIFSKHMACHAFTHKISDWNKYFSHKALQRVQTEPHSSSLKNVENSTSNFCQFVKICYGAE